jgi:alkylresorcinol/alkylpyrone synthase
VDARHLALPIEAYEDLETWGQSNNAWIEVAEELAEQSICRALTRAGLSEQDLDAIFFVSVTGIASPSIDARLMNRMNLRTNIKRNPIFGLGCVAGAAGIARAADYVRAYPDHNAVLVSVELCSLTWQRRNLSLPTSFPLDCLATDQPRLSSAVRIARRTAPRSSPACRRFIAEAKT